jgi:hypothetical protein
MLRRAALVRTDASEEHIAFIIRVKRIGDLGTMLAMAVTAAIVHRSLIRVTMMMVQTSGHTSQREQYHQTTEAEETV